MPDSDWIPILDYSDEASKRTIQFSPPNKDWTSAYRRCQYEQYGAIRSWRFNTLQDNHQLTCYIEFEDSQVVADLMSRGYIHINDYKIEIKRMLHYESDDSAHSAKKASNNTTLQLLPDESLAENVLDAVNDDCLRSIFRKLHLSTLHTVSNVCVRFRRIAMETFRLKCKNEFFQLCDVLMDFPISLQRVDKFLQIFGPTIEKLKIAREDVAFDETMLNDLLRMIGKHCTNIYALEIDYRVEMDFFTNPYNVHVSDEMLTEVSHLFRRLKHLKFIVESSQTFTDLLSSCSQLESLRIRLFYRMPITPAEIVLPKLHSLYLDSDCCDYLQFFKRNRQLKTISISDHQAQTTLFQDIADNFPNVDSLSIQIREWKGDNYAANVLHLAELKRLQCLRFDCNRNNVSSFMRKLLQNNVTLKHLELTNIQVDDGAAIDSISQMESVEELTFKIEWCGHYGYYWISGLNTNHLKRLAERLPNLTKLTISELEDVQIMDIIKQVVPFAKQLAVLRIIVSSFHTELPDFNQVSVELSEVIRKREKPTKLTIAIDCGCFPEDGNVLQVKYVKAINNDWLSVNIDFSLKEWVKEYRDH